jgi:tRNA threonylcarbamoyladenosine biosynthesis protein TsaB
MALILNIDSSMQEGSVSLARDGSMLQHLTNPDQKDHAAFVHIAVKELLRRQDVAPAELDAIAITSGPGSYTGLRVGFAAAKGLSFALHKPLISISTTEVMAKAIWLAGYREADYYCPMIDARRDEVFTATYNSRIEEIKAAHAMIVTEMSFDFLPEAATVLYFGTGAGKWKKISKKANAFFPEIVSIYDAQAVLSFERFLKKDFTDIAHSVPLYGKEFYNR